MFVVGSYSMAVILCVVTMLCWGSWANTQKLAGKRWPFQLFYWDYALGVLLLTLVFALTLGSNGSVGRSFVTDLGQASLQSLGMAFLGGVIFNLANILLVAAIDIAGMSVAFPVGIGLALVLGVLTNYAATPVGNPVMLFAGVLGVVIAIILSSLAYRRRGSSRRQQSAKGLVISLVAGGLMGYFYRFVAASMFPIGLEEGRLVVTATPGMLSPYTALVVFALGLCSSTFVFNTIVMARPFVGEPVKLSAYFSEGDRWLHLIGILGGAVWAVGMSLSILASSAAGFAISYGLGQGATLVAVLWGVFVWREFRDAPVGTNRLLAAMFVAFLVGLGLIVAARLY